MLTSRTGKARVSVTPSFEVRAHKGIPGFLHCKKKRKRKNPEAVPLPYLPLLCPTTATTEKKEGKERQEGVWPHFTITEGQMGAMNSFGTRLFPSDWSCWSCHQQELEEAKCPVEHPSYLGSIEVQADVGETQEQTQPLNYSCHQQ